MSSEERISIDIREQTNNKLIFISLHYVHTCIYAITKEQNIYHRAQFIVLEYTKLVVKKPTLQQNSLTSIPHKSMRSCYDWHYFASYLPFFPRNGKSFATLSLCTRKAMHC